MTIRKMTPPSAIVFDFDGTISTLRAGWEQVMAPYMKECIAGGAALSAAEEQALMRDIEQYIDESTGVQTIYQMRWLAGAVQARGWNPVVLDEWEYKRGYNERLLARVNERVRMLEEGRSQPEDYLIQGASALLASLAEQGIELYVASGTDHPDVVREAKALGVAGYFKRIAGAPVSVAACSKERVLGDLLETSGVLAERIAVIGDGKVEIALAKERGCLALGLASDEERRQGLNPVKAARLDQAGADWIAGDFLDAAEWARRLGVA